MKRELLKYMVITWCVLSCCTVNAQETAAVRDSLGGQVTGNPEAEQVEEKKKGIELFNFVTMSGDWYIAYRNGVAQTQADDSGPVVRGHHSEIMLKRSYFTLEKQLNDVFSVRYTMDLTVDTEGDDAGNVETRLKYLYVKAKPNLHSNVFRNTWIEVGMVHEPWLDYEQKINTYRVQDNMFIERNRIMSSADFGVTVGGNIGPSIDKDFLKGRNGAMDGKYFSYVLGLYNGGGYSGKEVNTNKVISGRLSFRPFAAIFPEIQLSTYFATGKGNSEYSPNYNQFIGFLAYTGKQLTLTAQAHTGEGDFRARYVDANNPGKALKNRGYSFFGEYEIPKTGFAVWGRYDRFNVYGETTEETDRYIGGVTYRINDFLRLVGDIEHNRMLGEKNDIFELNLEVSF